MEFSDRAARMAVIASSDISFPEASTETKVTLLLRRLEKDLAASKPRELLRFDDEKEGGWNDTEGCQRRCAYRYTGVEPLPRYIKI